MLENQSIVLFPDPRKNINDEIPHFTIIYDNLINAKYVKQTESQKKTKVNVQPKIDTGINKKDGPKALPGVN